MAGLTPTLGGPTTNYLSAPKTSSVSPGLVDPASADFGITCSPTSLTYVQGGSGSSACTVTSVNSFAGSVSITVLDDFHTLTVNGTIAPPLSFAKSLVANGTASFDLVVAGGTPFVYPVVAIGVGGQPPISHTFVLETFVNPVGGPNFPDYTVSLSAGSISIAHGGSSNPTITLTSVNGWASSVNLGVSLSGSLLGLNAPTLSFAGGTTIAVGTFLGQPSFTTTATATLSIATTATTTLGVYIAIIQFNGGTSQPFVQHTAILTITVT